MASDPINITNVLLIRHFNEHLFSRIFSMHNEIHENYYSMNISETAVHKLSTKVFIKWL